MWALHSRRALGGVCLDALEEGWDALKGADNASMGCGAVPRGDATRRALAAFVAMEPGMGEPSVAELRAGAAARLPRPAVPAVMRVVAEIPLMPVGKPDVRALVALLGEEEG